MGTSIKPLAALGCTAALAVLWTVSAPAQQPPPPTQEYYERETNQHLGHYGDSWYYIHRLVQNGDDHHDFSDLFTYRDTTWLVERSLDSKEVRDKTVLRVEHRTLYYDKAGEPKFENNVDYVIDKRAEQLLPKEFNYADLDNPIWPCTFEYRAEGIWLVYDDSLDVEDKPGEKVHVYREHFLVPVTDFEHMFPEYSWFPSNNVPIETIEGFSGTEGWYYVNFAPKCMTDPVGICRQVVVPVPEALMKQARKELLAGTHEH